SKSVDLGRKLFEKEAARLQLKAKKILDDDQITRVLSDHGFHKIEDMFAAIGYGKLAPRTVLIRFVPSEKLAAIEENKPTRLQKVSEVVKRALRLGEDRISVKGIDDVMVYRARCCSPIRGEPVVGYITQGKGVAVHAKRCTNAANLMINRERIVDVDWVGTDNTAGSYAVKLAVTTEDRQGMLADLTLAIAGIKTNIRDVHTDVFNNGSARIDVVVDISDVKHLERVIGAIKGVSGVIDVERAGT
ncbi:MAG: bifunctional (p)ppGpp synthetase/guanosine-3',5'-bis(diphosphate) 3'-pyrophosphohydrolase, partial [Blastocatellia bacterium]|nr:bifunctional (p)ppGpp synthetase/guanosine-3',5'-bis(diphosphate) 3'-pyrophosphohydrolase [Blastocatellia bacterium]